MFKLTSNDGETDSLLQIQKSITALDLSMNNHSITAILENTMRKNLIDQIIHFVVDTRLCKTRQKTRAYR